MTQLSITGPELSAPQLQQELSRLRLLHHSHCMFFKAPPVAGLKFEFQADGTLLASTTFEEAHQGYDGRVHGGLVAAIIDASMTQCLMGHGVVAYTIELSVRYREPISLHETTHFATRIVDEKRRLIYTLDCSVQQGTQTRVRATGKFFKAVKDHTNQDAG